MARDFGKPDRLRREREERDARARAEHEAAVAAAPHERRHLLRAATGELVSYTDAERGVARGGLGPNINTWWGWVVFTVLAGAGTGLIVAVSVADHLDAPPDPPWWFVPLFCLLGLPLVWLGLHYTRREWSAHRARQERGVPRPAE